MRLYGQAYRYPAYAGNLTLSHQSDMSEDMLWRAMDRLEDTAGHDLNKYATETGVHLLPYDKPYGILNRTERPSALRHLARKIREGIFATNET